LVDEALTNSKVQSAVKRPISVDTSHGVPVLGTSSVGWAKVYLDRHFPLSALPVGDRKLNVKAGLIRHERLEPVLEDILGWLYSTIAHPVAQDYEERDYKWLGFDPKEIEQAFASYIDSDERTPLKKVSVDAPSSVRADWPWERWGLSL
jgi:hypothetical protein